MNGLCAAYSNNTSDNPFGGQTLNLSFTVSRCDANSNIRRPAISIFTASTTPPAVEATIERKHPAALTENDEPSCGDTQFPRIAISDVDDTNIEIGGGGD